MNTKQLLIFLFKFIWKPTLQIILIMTTLAFIRVNIITINVTVLMWGILFKLLTDRRSLTIKGWFLKTAPKTIMIVTALFGIILWLGAYGLIGSILILLIIAGWRIAANWKLYDQVTTWGANKLKGKEEGDFDWTKIN